MSIKSFLKRFKKVELRAINTPVLMTNLLSGHRALIIGGCGGIGFEIAKAFQKSDCNIMITGTNKEKLEKASAQLNNCEFYEIDCNHITSMLHSLDHIYSSHDYNIDIVVYAAGIHGPSNFFEITEKDFDDVISVNLKGMFFVNQCVGNLMKSHAIKGHILNISSASALKNGVTPYEISKNAVESLIKGSAQRLIPYGIVVNGLGPGPVATKMLGRDNNDIFCEENPSKRMATAQEIANWAVLLCSSISDLVVGETFYVTGGSGNLYIDR